MLTASYINNLPVLHPGSQQIYSVLEHLQQSSRSSSPPSHSLHSFCECSIYPNFVLSLDLTQYRATVLVGYDSHSKAYRSYFDPPTSHILISRDEIVDESTPGELINHHSSTASILDMFPFESLSKTMGKVCNKVIQLKSHLKKMFLGHKPQFKLICLRQPKRPQPFPQIDLFHLGSDQIHTNTWDTICTWNPIRTKADMYS